MYHDGAATRSWRLSFTAIITLQDHNGIPGLLDGATRRGNLADHAILYN